MNDLLRQAGFVVDDALSLQWAGRAEFTVLCIGAGARPGVNDLLQRWHSDPQRCERLHLVALQADPSALQGVHRQLQSDPRITLTTAVGDVATLLPQLRLGADAICLDAHLPNLDVRLLRHCARLSRPQAVLFAGHLCARPRWHSAAPAMLRTADERRVLVIGAGIAGAAVADRLAARGWQVTVLDRASAPATGASGLWLGAMHPHFSQDDCLLSRASRAAMLLSVQRLNQLRAQSPHSGWHPCGVAHPATSAEEEQTLRQLCERLALPQEVVRFCERGELSALAGAPLGFGGYWHGSTGVVDVRQWVQGLLAQPGVHFRPGTTVNSLQQMADGWQALGEQGQVLAEAPAVVLANAGDAPRLAPHLETLLPVRGQMSAFDAADLQAPQAAVVGHGYVLPAVKGRVSVGATYDPGSSSHQARDEDHALNLQSLEVLLPHHPKLGIAQVKDSFVGTRYAANDHLPLIGAVPDLSDTRWLASAAGKRLTDWPRRQGLYCAVGYGSRGLSWSTLAGEIIASQLCGEPAPLEATLMDALDPARFGQRGVRRGAISDTPP